MSPPTHARGAGSLEQELHSQRIRESSGRGSVPRGGAPVTATDAEGSGASEASRRQEAQWRRSGGGAEAERRRSHGASAGHPTPSNRFGHSTLRFALVRASCEIKRAFCTHASCSRSTTPPPPPLLSAVVRTNKRWARRSNTRGPCGLHPPIPIGAEPPVPASWLLCGFLVPGFLEIKKPP